MCVSHERRADGVGSHTGAGDLRGDRAHEPDRGVLGRGVGRGVLRARPAGGRGDGDDPSALALEHGGQRRARAQECARRVDVELRPPVCERGARERRAAGDARVVDEDIDRAGALEERDDGRLVGDVARPGATATPAARRPSGADAACRPSTRGDPPPSSPAVDIHADPRSGRYRAARAGRGRRGRRRRSCSPRPGVSGSRRRASATCASLRMRSLSGGEEAAAILGCAASGGLAGDDMHEVGAAALRASATASSTGPRRGRRRAGRRERSVATRRARQRAPSGNRSRCSPPYASSRRFVAGERKEREQVALAEVELEMSKPASATRRAAARRRRGPLHVGRLDRAGTACAACRGVADGRAPAASRPRAVEDRRRPCAAAGSAAPGMVSSTAAAPPAACDASTASPIIGDRRVVAA